MQELIVLILLGGIIVFFIKKAKAGSGHFIRCPNCKYEGPGKYSTKGSFAMEVVLWLLLIVPGIIYSIWRLTTRGWRCPQCGFEYVVKRG